MRQVVAGCCVVVLLYGPAAHAQDEPGEVADRRITEPALAPSKLITERFPISTAYDRGFSRGFGAAAIAGGLQVTAWSALLWWPTIDCFSNTDGESGGINALAGAIIAPLAVGLTAMGLAATGYGVYEAHNNSHQEFTDPRLRRAQLIGFIQGMGVGLAIQGGFNVLASSFLLPVSRSETFSPELHTLFWVMLGVGGSQLITGAFMALAIKKPPLTRKVSLMPVFTPRWSGLVLGGRF